MSRGSDVSMIFALLAIGSLTLLCTEAVIRPNGKLSVMDGEGFLAYLEVPKGFGTIKSCWFHFNDYAKEELELNSTESFETVRGESVSPFSSSVCGIRVQKVTLASIGTWTLEAESVYSDFEKDQVTISVVARQKTNFNTFIQRDIGQGSITCSKHDTLTKLCKINDEAGESWDKCEVSRVLRPNMTFNCRMYNWGRMLPSTEHIVVGIKNTTESAYAISSFEESDSSVIMRCQFKDTVFACLAEMPDRKNGIYIMDGMYNGRYSTYDTSTSKSKCALEVPKPLDANEKGLWRIINYDASTPSGCLYYIGQSRQEIIEKELSKLSKVRELKVYKPENEVTETIEIGCMVPFAIDDCYLRDPNTTVYFPDSFRFERESLYGKCSFTRMPIIEGRWTCGVRGRHYDKEVLQHIDVVAESKAGKVLTENVKFRKNSQVEFMCRSAFESPLSHCAFIDPQGGVHLVGTVNSLKTAGHVQYFGSGIQFGECGAKLNGLTSSDFGDWKCHFVVSSNNRPSTFVIRLSQSETAQATSVGLGIGVTIIVVLVLGVIVGTVFYRRRNLSARHDFSSADPLDMSSTRHMSSQRSSGIVTTQT